MGCYTSKSLTSRRDKAFHYRGPRLRHPSRSRPRVALIPPSETKRACTTRRASWLQVMVATVAVREGSGSCHFALIRAAA